MSDDWASAWQRARYEQLVEDLRPGLTATPWQGSGGRGGGADVTISWTRLLLGTLGAILGGIVLGLFGAMVGAALFGGALRSFIRPAASNAVSRVSVALWTLCGLVGGAIFGMMLADNATQAVAAATNMGLFGALIFGMVRLRKRARA